MSLLEHLEELRGRLIWMMASVAVGAVAGWLLFDPVVEALLRPARPFLEEGPTEGRLIFTGPLEGFTVRLKVAVYVGFGLALPIVLFHVWRFVSPGLRDVERRYAVPFIASGMILFGLGVTFAYYSMPQALRFLIGTEITGADIRPLLAAGQYLNFALFYHAAFGIAFEFPVALMFLTLTGVLGPDQMARYRRHVFVGLSFFVALFTPSVDWYTMTILTVVMYALYEATIWITRLVQRRRRRREG